MAMPITCSSKPGGFAVAPISIDTSSCVSAGFAGRLAHQIDDHRVAGLDRAALDRLVPGRALAQPLQRLLDGVVLDGGRRPPQLQAE